MNGVPQIAARGKTWLDEVEQLDDDFHERVLLSGMEGDCQTHLGGCRCVRELSKATHLGGLQDKAESVRLMADNVMRCLDTLVWLAEGGATGATGALTTIRDRLVKMNP